MYFAHHSSTHFVFHFSYNAVQRYTPSHIFTTIPCSVLRKHPFSTILMAEHIYLLGKAEHSPYPDRCVYILRCLANRNSLDRDQVAGEYWGTYLSHTNRQPKCQRYLTHDWLSTTAILTLKWHFFQISFIFWNGYTKYKLGSLLDGTCSYCSNY